MYGLEQTNGSEPYIMGLHWRRFQGKIRSGKAWPLLSKRKTSVQCLVLIGIVVPPSVTVCPWCPSRLWKIWWRSWSLDRWSGPLYFWYIYYTKFKFDDVDVWSEAFKGHSILIAHAKNKRKGCVFVSPNTKAANKAKKTLSFKIIWYTTPFQKHLCCGIGCQYDHPWSDSYFIYRCYSQEGCFGGRHGHRTYGYRYAANARVWSTICVPWTTITSERLVWLPILADVFGSCFKIWGPLELSAMIFPRMLFLTTFFCLKFGATKKAIQWWYHSHNVWSSYVLALKWC